MSTKSFADVLRAIRRTHSLTQEDAAKEWGVNLRTLEGWESGRFVPTDFVAKCVIYYLQHHPRKGS